MGSVERIVRARRTQTNEAARCAIILPALGLLGPRPLALIEVGAAAGLCLYPDRWRIDYGLAGQTGPRDAPLIQCESVSSLIATPMPLPEQPLQVVWRAGIDLAPLNVNSEDDIRWLRCLVWPEHHARFERLGMAIDIARREPPHIVRGDLVVDLESVAAQAPPDATLVVFHSATLGYVPTEDRARFVEGIRALRSAHWVSNEGAGVFPEMAIGAPVIGSAGIAVAIDRAALADSHVWSGVHGTAFLTMLDGRPIAWSDPHGASIEWIG